MPDLSSGEGRTLIRLVTLATIAASVAACHAQPQAVGDSEFDPAKVAYFRDDRTAVCFAVASYHRWDSSGRFAAGMTATAVPCSPAVESLLRNGARR